MDIIFAGGKFRAKSQFENIAKISSTRKIGVIQYTNEGSALALKYGTRRAKRISLFFVCSLARYDLNDRIATRSYTIVDDLLFDTLRATMLMLPFFFFNLHKIRPTFATCER